MQIPFQNVLTQFGRANSAQEFPRSLIERLSNPNSGVHISIPVMMNTGETKI